MAKKKINPHVRNGLIQARMSNQEMQIVLQKAEVYHHGDISKFTREAALNYRPLKKVKVGR